MSKDRTTLFTIFTIGIMVLFSCKKSSSSSAASNISGNWRLTSSVADTNHNGIMDAGEVITGDTSWLHQTLTFNGNGTLSGSYYNSISTAKWEFASNNTWLKVTSTDTGLSYGQVNYLQIINLSSSALTLKDTVGGINWFMYTKL